jgi:hypothetical protein
LVVAVHVNRLALEGGIIDAAYVVYMFMQNLIEGVMGELAWWLRDCQRAWSGTYGGAACHPEQRQWNH